METLKIHLFGRLRLYRGERSLDRFPTVAAAGVSWRLTPC